MKITMEEFIKLINDATKTNETTRIDICEYDYDVFSIRVNKDKDIMYLDLPTESKYDLFFEELKKNFEERYDMIWSHDITGEYKAFMVIDERVVVEFNYKLSEGQNWLYQHEGE